ncbi:uncharacterized protein DEA37_0006302 [Paragonimus westermani]|uniref:Reverse transcriptase domain-containing protein n=1 Tax=Paragonimus westermani TaxID=34504 RepID=A0A5J4NRN8_9TREM|nr:uncharacterized protein DEA37_0006302 [Paragonimus westermani]
MSGRHTKELVQSDMSANMQEFVISACEEAFQLFQMEKDVANYLKNKMRKRYLGCWHCIVGEKFGSGHVRVEYRIAVRVPNHPDVLSEDLMHAQSVGDLKHKMDVLWSMRKTRQLDLEVQFENLYAQLSVLDPTSTLDAEQLKSTLVNSCYQYLRSSPASEQFLTKEHLVAVENLKRNENILISKPDKGAGIVLLNKADYINKIRTILDDQTKFRKMENEKDKTPQIEKAISKSLRCLKQRGIIDSTTFERIRPIGTTIPRLYGLPKIHKIGVPLRPILDMWNSPYHPLAKWLSQILDPVRRKLSTHSLRDSYDLVNAIKDANLTGQSMFSLDVTSLFTNVPLKETIDYLCDYIENSDMDIQIPSVELKQLLYLCTYNVQFKFNEGIYRQKDGVAMGSPLGPLFADIFMAKLENEQLSPAIRQCNFYKRYVDDILCVLDNNVDPTDILATFNSAHQNLQFSLETEMNSQLGFLDVRLRHRADGSIQRAIHRKDTWTDQYIHFNSFVPLASKRNLINCLTRRALRICTEDTIAQELAFIRAIFIQNGYPERFIDRAMQQRRVKDRLHSVEKKAVHIGLPFKGDTLAETITRKLTSAVNRTFYAAKLRVHFTSNPVLCSRLKDKVPISAASFCVYSFTCFYGTSYVGRTTRRLSERIREHHPAWFNSGITKSVCSAILSRLMGSNHAVNVKDAFRPIYRVKAIRSRAVRSRILSAAEAIGIRMYNTPVRPETFRSGSGFALANPHPVGLSRPIVQALSLIQLVLRYCALD